MTLKSVDGLEKMEASDTQKKFQLDYFDATAIAELSDAFFDDW